MPPRRCLPPYPPGPLSQRGARAARLLAALLLVLLGLISPGAAVRAQGAAADAWTTGLLKMRVGPGQQYGVITQLISDTALHIEAHSADGGWLLGVTLDGHWRGWVGSSFLRYRADFRVTVLPASEELITTPPAYGLPAGTPVEFEAVDLNGGTDLIYARAAAIDLDAYPVIPDRMGRARAIFMVGQQQGRAANVISKVGDCNSIGWVFLHPFAEGRYDLGPYGDLADVIATFSESLGYRTYAAANGLNANAVLDPIWASPDVCQAGESPLLCEYRVHNPAAAIIMFGTNDLVTLNTTQFDQNLRRVVQQTIQADVVPILSTFPRHLAIPDRSITYNQIVIRVALDFNVPVMNLGRALEPLPDHGIAPDGFHLSGPLTYAGEFSEANLRTGFPLRNLVTLQALDAVWRAALR